MKKYTSPIIDVQELLQLTLSDAYVKIFDVSNGKDAKLNYNKKHLRDAIFVDINSQLTNIKKICLRVVVIRFLQLKNLEKF